MIYGRTGGDVAKLWGQSCGNQGWSNKTSFTGLTQRDETAAAARLPW
jgi:hypothetical protein